MKIGDLGTCVHTIDMRKSVCGTTPYLAPEILSVGGPAGGYSFPVDVWAMGVTMHEMLTTRLPFDGDTPMHIYKRILKETYSPPKTASEDASIFLHACMQKNPNNRPTAAILSNFSFFN